MSGADTIVMALVAVVKGAKNEVAWLIEELPMSKFNKAGSTDGVTDFASAHTIDEEHFIRHHTIRDIKCSGNADSGRQCSACIQSRKALIRRCTLTAQLRQKSLDENTTHLVLERNPSLMKEKINMQHDKLKKKRDSYRHKLFKRLSDEGGVEVPMNDGLSTIFSDETKNNMSKFMSEEVSRHYDSEFIKGLPLDTKIAFNHPNPHYSQIKIFIGGEMPHWVKKFRNALDSKKRDLTFRGKRFNLALLHMIWTQIGDGNVSGINNVRNYKFGEEHFNLNSYNKMRVFLAVQIPSQTMIRMVNDACKSQEDGGCGMDIKEYEPMLEIFDRVDRLVDIINATRVKNGKDLKVEHINHPRHRHIYELFSVLQLFKEWKGEAGGFTSKFITRETYEDLKWMVFGLAGVACTYLDEDKSKQLHQGRSGSDVCEHFFAKLRQGSPNVTLAQANQKLSKISAQGASDSHLFMFKGKQNAAGTKRENAAYFDPVAKRPSKKN